MVSDKLAWAHLSTLSGMGFVFWGLCNLGVFGLSLVMHKDNFNYHFAYTGNGKFLQPFKSMMAAEDLLNVAWTSSCLILGGFYLQQRVGSMAAFKIFGLSLMASYLATVSLGPTTVMGQMNLRGLSPLKWDSIDSKQGRMVGADLMAGTCVYACMCAHGLWIPVAAIACVDLAYYGPMGVAMPTAAAIGALTML